MTVWSSCCLLLCYGKYSGEIRGVGSAAVPENEYFSFNCISCFNKKTDFLETLGDNTITISDGLRRRQKTLRLDTF